MGIRSSFAVCTLAPALALTACSSSNGNGTSSGGTSISSSSGGTGSTTSSAGSASGTSGTSTGGLPACTITLPAELPANLVAPSGTATLQLVGIGTQNYTCAFTNDGGTAAAWSAAVPSASLYWCTDGGPHVGRHFGGPTWEWDAGDDAGSSFVGNKPMDVSDPSPDDAGFDIPWLLLPKLTGSDAGKFVNVSYVQRLSTLGGKLPGSYTCDPGVADGGASDSGVAYDIPYAATYVFYE